jgi:hypothetical protein
MSIWLSSNGRNKVAQEVQGWKGGMRVGLEQLVVTQDQEIQARGAQGDGKKLEKAGASEGQG